MGRGTRTKKAVSLSRIRKISQDFVLKTKAKKTFKGSENPLESVLKYPGCAESYHSHLSCEGTNATLCVSVLFQTNKFKHISVHGGSRLEIRETLSPAVTAQPESTPNSGALPSLLQCMFTAHN